VKVGGKVVMVGLGLVVVGLVELLMVVGLVVLGLELGPLILVVHVCAHL